MASFIPAYVLQKNTVVFLNTDGSLGMSTEIPTPDGGGVPDGDFWAVPVNDGSFTGFTYLPYNPANAVEAVKPVPYAMAVCRISGRLTGDYYYAIGTIAEYITASGGGAAMPTAIPTALLKNSKPLIPYCQCVGTLNSDDNFVVTMALPTLGSGEKFYPFGYYNDNAFTTASSSGYSTAAALLTFLQASWATVSSPSVSIAWTLNGDDSILTGVVTGGAESDDSFCAQVIAINLSN